MARPTKLTAEVQAEVCEFIAQGNYRYVAAEAAGVPHRTFKRWMAIGKKAKSGAYAEFWHQVQKAEKRAETVAVKAVRDAGEADAKHYQWWLERKFPERWSSKRLDLAKLEDRIRMLENGLASQNAPPSSPTGTGSGGSSGGRDSGPPEADPD